MSNAKIHLIPKTSLIALCASKPHSSGRLAVRTRKEFNALPADERCGRCDAILNGRRHRTAEPQKMMVAARSLAAYRAHRTRLAQQLKGASKSVRADLAAKLAEFDAKLGSMTVAA